MFMKRFGAFLALAFLASLIVGCDSGTIKEGLPDAKEQASPQPSAFQAQMQKDAKNMQLKGGRPKDAPATKK